MIRMTRWSVSIQSSLTPPYGTLLRLCDGRLTSEADISSEDSDALRETRLEFDLSSYRTNAAQNRQAEDVLERQK